MGTYVPTQWSTGLFGCLYGRDAGFNCCVQNCLCGVCVWGDALAKAGVRDSAVYTVAVFLGGRSLLDEFAGLLARRRLAEKYGIQEDQTYACLVSCCCAPCARFQELNTVMEREHLKYGCARTVAEVQGIPAPQRIRRVERV